MRIGIDIGILSVDSSTLSSGFLLEIIRNLAAASPNDEFYLFGIGRQIVQPFTEKNIVEKKIGTSIKSPVYWRWRQNIKLPLALRKEKIDVLISIGGAMVSNNIPQCLLYWDNWDQHLMPVADKSFISFFKKNIIRSLSNAEVVIVPDNATQLRIQQEYSVGADKIICLPPVASKQDQQFSDDVINTVKKEFTKGKEYFVAAGDVLAEELVFLLKAFSVFKKRMQTSMKMVIASKNIAEDLSFSEKLNSYKYRDDVVLFSGPDGLKLAELVASAYAMIHPSAYFSFFNPVLIALQHKVPAICFESLQSGVFSGYNLLTVQNDNYNDLAEKMMLIYRDENLRNSMKANEVDFTSEFTMDNVVQKLREAIYMAAASTRK